MRKLVAILLLVVMSLQLSWAVASEYCSHHERGTAAQHFGHHNDSDSKQSAKSSDQSKQDSTNTSDYSHACHAHGSVVGMMGASTCPTGPSLNPERLRSTDSSPRPTDHISSIERPNWLRLA